MSILFTILESHASLMTGISKQKSIHVSVYTSLYFVILSQEQQLHSDVAGSVTVGIDSADSIDPH